jgi:cell division septation protein DedD
MRRFFARRATAAAPPRPPRRAQKRHTEADILTILWAGTQGVLPDELCAAEGITLETYEAWKAQYSGLSLEQIKDRRLRERRSRRIVLGVASVVVVAAGGYYAFTRGATPVRPVAYRATSSGGSPIVVRSSPARVSAAIPAAVPAVPKASPAAVQAASVTLPPPVVSRPVETAARVADAGVREADTAKSSGYSVQVAAVPTPELAQAMIAQLARGGHRSYVSRTTVNDTVLFRVRVGPFESREDANVVAQRLETDGYRGAWIAR